MTAAAPGGFEPEPTHYRLDFTQTDLKGLEVTVAGLSIGEFEEMTGLADAAGIRRADLESMDAEQAKSASDGVMRLLAMFAGALVSWNVTRRGKPVAADLAGVKSQELGFIFKIIMAWMSAIADVDIPLPSGSPPGPPEEEALGLAGLSQSLAS